MAAFLEKHAHAPAYYSAANQLVHRLDNSQTIDYNAGNFFDYAGNLPRMLIEVAAKVGAPADLFERTNGHRRVESYVRPEVTLVDTVFENMLRALSSGYHLTLGHRRALESTPGPLPAGSAGAVRSSFGPTTTSSSSWPGARLGRARPEAGARGRAHHLEDLRSINGVLSMPLTPPCPICGLAAGAPIAELRFGRKAHLPDAITLHGCVDCDFAFTWPRDPVGYRDHYAAVASGTAQRHGQYRNLPQAEILAGLIASRPIRSVLDFGCGGGGLLHVLAERFPSPVPGLRRQRRLPLGTCEACGSATSSRKAAHDLVILGHVVEHAWPISTRSRTCSVWSPKAASFHRDAGPEALRDVPTIRISAITSIGCTSTISRSALILKIAPARGCRCRGGRDLSHALRPGGEFYTAQYVVLQNRPERTDRPRRDRGLSGRRGSPLGRGALSLTGRKFFVGFGDNYLACCRAVRCTGWRARCSP